MVFRANGSEPGQGDCELVLRPSRRKWGLVPAGCLGFVAVAALTVPRSDPMFWFPVISFGFGCLLSLVRLVSPWDFLRLTPQGYEEHALFRSSHVAWSTSTASSLTRSERPPWSASCSPVLMTARQISPLRAILRRHGRRPVGHLRQIRRGSRSLLNDWRVRQQPHRGL